MGLPQVGPVELGMLPSPPAEPTDEWDEWMGEVGRPPEVEDDLAAWEAAEFFGVG